MNEVEFRNWLLKNDCTAKVADDHISRIKRVDREINHCDIDEMEKIKNISLPVGKY